MDTHTHISTHQQDFSPTHIPQQNTHCVIAPFVHFSHPPAISASTSHIGSLILTLVLTSVTELPSHRPSSLVQLCTTWEKCSAHILPNTKAFSKYSENFGPIWQHCNDSVLTSLRPWTAPPPNPPPPSMKSSCPTIAAPSDEFPIIFFFYFYTVCVDVKLTCSPATRLPPPPTSLWNLPTHVRPSKANSKPLWHWQRWLPARLMHFEWAPHKIKLSAHSSMSAAEEKERKYVFIWSHVPVKMASLMCKRKNCNEGPF